MRMTIPKNASFYPHILEKMERLAIRMGVPLSCLMAYRTLHPSAALEDMPKVEGEEIKEWIMQEKAIAKKKARRSGL